MILDASALEDEDPDAWKTGTAIDEFTPIYEALAVPTKTRRGFAPHEVDLMDISVAARLLGVGKSPMMAELDELRELKRRREAGESVGWEDLNPQVTDES